jgi:hypothetical protein
MMRGQIRLERVLQKNSDRQVPYVYVDFDSVAILVDDDIQANGFMAQEETDWTKRLEGNILPDVLHVLKAQTRGLSHLTVEHSDQFAA